MLIWYDRSVIAMLSFHQNDIKIDNKVVYFPLTCNATVNLLCDKLATSTYNLPHGDF